MLKVNEQLATGDAILWINRELPIAHLFSNSACNGFLDEKYMKIYTWLADSYFMVRENPNK